MISKRIIPCLDVRDGRVVKGVHFEDIKDVEDPVAMAAFYDAEGADELVFYDITASSERRGMFTDVLRGVASQVFIPLTAGGAVRGLGDFDRLLKHGADKVSVNSGAIDNPRIIEEGARRYGSQCVVLSMDVKRVDGQFCVFARGGRENTEIDALEWAKMGEAGGAGELVINSMDADGDRRGFDLELLAEISARVSIPIVASGGAGRMEHFADLFALPGIEAGLAASIFHYRDISIGGLKAFLAQKGVPMRITQ